MSETPTPALYRGQPRRWYRSPDFDLEATLHSLRGLVITVALFVGFVALLLWWDGQRDWVLDEITCAPEQHPIVSEAHGFVGCTDGGAVEYVP